MFFILAIIIKVNEMQFCQHSNKVSLFCINQHCSWKESAGCQKCIKKYHSHLGKVQCLKEDQLLALITKLTIDSNLKPKCRSIQESIQIFFNNLKNQLSISLDLASKNLVNRIGYPYLHGQGKLATFKRIKNKEYKKIVSKDLRKFYLDIQNLNPQKICVNEQQLYIKQFTQTHTILSKLQSLTKEYEQIISQIYKGYSHDSTLFGKIQSFSKYVTSSIKADHKIIQLSKSRQKLKRPMISKNNSYLTDKKQKFEAIQKLQTFVETNYKIQNSKKEKENNYQENKYKELTLRHVRSFSTEDSRQNKRMNTNQINLFSDNKNFKVQFDNFQDSSPFKNKEKQIFERKQHLMNMLNSSQMSKKMDLSTPENKKSDQTPEIITSIQKKISLQQRVSLDKNKFNLSQPPKTEYLKVPAPPMLLNMSQINESQINNKKNTRKRTSSFLSSINQPLYTKRQKQAQADPYKYAQVIIPSNDSGSQDSKSFIDQPKNQILSSNVIRSGITQTKSRTILQRLIIPQRVEDQDLMTSSSPVGRQKHFTQQQKKQDISDEEKKSAALYLKALKVNNIMAIDLLKTALNYSKSNISAAEYLSYIYLKQSKAKQCLNLCTQYLEILTKIDAGLEDKLLFIENKTASLNQLGRYSESIVILDECIFKYNSSQLYKCLADAYFSVGMIDKCIYYYEKCIQIDSTTHQSMYNLSVSLFMQGNYNNAEIWIKKALLLNKCNSEYQQLSSQITNQLMNNRFKHGQQQINP